MSITSELMKILPNLANIDQLYDIYTLLGYDVVIDERYISTKDWSEKAKKLVYKDPQIIVEIGEFRVFYVELKHLTFQNERTIIQAISKHERNFVISFFSQNMKETHLVNPYFFDQQNIPISEQKMTFKLQRYILGTGDPMRTTAEQMSLIEMKDGNTWIDAKLKHDSAFDVEAVTENFFHDYNKMFTELKDHLNEQTDDISKIEITEYALQLLNRIMFIYFVQRKGWLNNDKNYLLNHYQKFKKLNEKNFYKYWLCPIFFYGFNKEEQPSDFILHEVVQKQIAKVPFLNGGLFSKNSLDELDLTVSDEIMDTILIQFFARYNFTISEDTPLEQDVAVDPEMLGKVYESLITEDEQSRAGIFYTPRIEVDMMVRLALIKYLEKVSRISKRTLMSFIFNPSLELISEQQQEKILTALQKCRIVDPACGSGAFLVATSRILHELRCVLEMETLEKSVEIKKAILRDNIFGVDIKKWAIQMSELRLWLWLVVNIPTSDEQSPKKTNIPVLPNLDLKLRVGDSLLSSLLDRKIRRETGEKENDSQKILKLIKKLTKSKRDYYKGSRNSKKAIKELEKNLYRQLVEYKSKGTIDLRYYFFDKMKEKKLTEFLPQDINKDYFYWEIDFVEVFGEKDGFDIVIGNPPYVDQVSIKPANIEDPSEDQVKKYKEKLYQQMTKYWGNEYKKEGRSDYLVYFFYLSLHLLNKNGVHVFITSKSWIDVDYGKKLIDFLMKNTTIHSVIENQVERSFSAAINTIITVSTLHKDEVPVRFIGFKRRFEELYSLSIEDSKIDRDSNFLTSFTSKISLETSTYQLFLLSEAIIKLGLKWSIFFYPKPLLDLLEHPKLVPLGKIFDTSRGITTGANDYFYLPNKFIEIEQLDEEYIKLKYKNLTQSRVDPPNRFPKEYLTPTIKNSKELGMINPNFPSLFLITIPRRIDRKKLPKEVQKYINWGEAIEFTVKRGRDKGEIYIGYHNAQTLVSKEIWYHLQPSAGDFIFFKNIYKRLVVVDNRSTSYCINNVLYNLKFKNETENEISWIAFLNSVITWLMTEIFGQSTLGEGAVVLNTSGLQNLRILNVNSFNESQKQKAMELFESIKKREILTYFDELGVSETEDTIIFSLENIPQDRLRFEEYIFTEILGFTKAEMHEILVRYLHSVSNRIIRSGTK